MFDELKCNIVWREVILKLIKNRLALFSLCTLILLTLASIIGPMLIPYSYSDQLHGMEYQLPGWGHWFGTDYLGRDMLVRVLIGTRISLSIGILTSIIISVIGTIYGALSGLIGGIIDNIMMRFVEILYSIPDILIIILLSVVLKPLLTQAFEGTSFLKGLNTVGPGLMSIFITIISLYWVNMARIVRGQVLSLKEKEFVTAAKALGSSNLHIIFKHLIPNCIGPIIVTCAFQIPSAIFAEAFLSFIGLGVDPPMASLGSLTSDALNGIYSYPYLLIYPALFISVIILAFNLLGDALTDILDPRIKM